MGKFKCGKNKPFKEYGRRFLRNDAMFPALPERYPVLGRDGGAAKPAGSRTPSTHTKNRDTVKGIWNYKPVVCYMDHSDVAMFSRFFYLSAADRLYKHIFDTISFIREKDAKL